MSAEPWRDSAQAMLTKTPSDGLLAQRAGVISCAVPAGVVGALQVRGGADGGSHGPTPAPLRCIEFPMDRPRLLPASRCRL